MYVLANSAGSCMNIHEVISDSDTV